MTNATLDISDIYTSEEQSSLQEFFEAKKLKFKNEMLDDVSCDL